MISLFFYKKYLFHSEILLFKQSQEKDDLSCLSHRIRWSEDQSISECTSWRGSFLCTWTEFLRWHIQNGTHSAIKVTSTSEILTFTLCNLHKIVIKDFFSVMTYDFLAKCGFFKVPYLHNDALRTKFSVFICYLEKAKRKKQTNKQKNTFSWKWLNHDCSAAQATL